MTRRRVEGGALVAALLLALAAGCGADATSEHGAVPGARTVPQAQPAAARALRLPVMRPAASRTARAGDRAVTIDVQLRREGEPLRDAIHVVAPAFVRACGAALVDTSPALASGVVASAIVWVEGPAATFVTAPTSDRRPMVRMEGCRLVPSLQVAAPGSALMLVMRDSFPDSLVVVRSSSGQPADTVPFSMQGQLVPLQHRADSAGMVAVYSAQLPWARAFLVIAPPSSGAVADRDGRVRFTVDGRARFTRIRAWHPVLGSADASVPLGRSTSTQTVTLTFRR